MKTYLLFVLKRLVQLLAVILAGSSVAFFIAHLSPISPVEQILVRITGRAALSAEAEQAMRTTLTELFGLEVPLWQQYLNFIGRLPFLDFGPSLIAFPTPAISLVLLALPWTVGLLTVSILISWVLGNLLGALGGYFRESAIFKAIGILAIGVQPIPYYIVAFLLVIVFGLVWPILPISGGFSRSVAPDWSLSFVLSVLQHGLLPALSLIIVGLGIWFLTMRSLASTIVTEDYVTFAELAGVPKTRLIGRYVVKNALVPQLTGLAMALGSIFSGTIIAEQVFSYPGLGSLLVSAVNGGDTSLVLAICCISVVAVASMIFLIDLIQPILDPRIKVE